MKRSVRAERTIAVLTLALITVPASAGLRISEALIKGSEYDPQYLSAAADQRVTREQGEQERASLRPTLALRGSVDYGYTDASFAFGSQDDEYYQWSAGLELRQPLLRLDWGARMDRAEARDRLADARYHGAQIDFVARVSERYLNVLLAEDELRLAEAEAKAGRKSLEDTRKRYEVELVPGTDLKEAQARDDLMQAQLISARAAVGEARDLLEEITGYDRSPLPQLKPEFEMPPLGSMDEARWYQIAQENNTRLVTARLDTLIAETDRQSRKAEALPSVDAFATAGRNDSTDYALGQQADDARVGLELTVPIYAGGLNNSRMREATAKLDAARLALTQAEREVRSDIRKSVRDVEAAAAAERAYARALESSEAALAAVQAGYDAGTRTIADILDAQSRQVQARRDFNASRLDRLIKTLILLANAGTLTAEMVASMDGIFE